MTIGETASSQRICWGNLPIQGGIWYLRRHLGVVDADDATTTPSSAILRRAAHMTSLDTTPPRTANQVNRKELRWEEYPIDSRARKTMPHRIESPADGAGER